MNSWIPKELAAILSETGELSRAYLVGGCVRDWLLGIPVKDFDVEVYGLSYRSCPKHSSAGERPIWLADLSAS